MGEPDFHKAFVDGVAVEETAQEGTSAEGERYTLLRRAIGDLVVTSGVIVACDPLMMPDTVPFADMVQPGRYPVVLSVAERPSGDQRVAYAMLLLSEHAAVRWENATPQGKTLAALKPGHVFGYGVDSATGCFMDVDAASGLEEAGSLDLRALFDVLNKTYVPTWSWADLFTDETTRANVIAFSTGWGDGFYSSYWGYDADGQKVTLVTDFDVLDPSWLAR